MITSHFYTCRMENIMHSIWKESKKEIGAKRLEKDISVDVAIVGGGMAGILTAYLLKQQGIHSVILEGSKIASGQTGNTTAKITSGHNLIYDKITTKFGKETASLYASANQKAIAKYQEVIKNENIECHYKTLPNYVYSLRDPKLIEDEVKACKEAGLDAEFTLNTTLPFLVDGAIKLKDQGQFNPMEFINGLVPSLHIYEDTMVREIKENILVTPHGKVKADKIVVATHYPFINTPGYYFLRLHQERSYVIALEDATSLDGMYIDEDIHGFSFRNYEDKLLLGGSGHRTGDNKHGGCYERLRKVAKEYYPESKELYHWSAQDAMSLDSIPYIGQYSSATPNMYVATGFNKWGMTNSMVSAMLLNDLIIDKKNPFEEVYSPKRFTISASMMNLFEEGKQAVTGLVKQKFTIPDTLISEIKNGYGGEVDYQDEKVGVYKDDTGKVYMVTTKCPHLGCKLEWNQDELSWDCPCHGSRFNYEGELLDNPAMRGIHNIKIIE